MKTAITLAFVMIVIGVCVGIPQHQPYHVAPVAKVVIAPPETISEYNEKNPDGSYRYGYKLSDGTEKQEEGEPRLVGNEIKVFNRGFYTYIDPEGQIHQRNYFTDEAGFHVAGNDVPAPVGRV